MVALIFGAAFCSFDFYGGKFPGCEVVGTSAHVDFAGFDGEFEGIKDEVSGNPRPKFIAPLVEVHGSVDASALLVSMAVVARQRILIERPCC